MPRLRRDAIGRMNAGSAEESFWDKSNEWRAFEQVTADAVIGYIHVPPFANLANDFTILMGSGLDFTYDEPSRLITLSATGGSGSGLTHPQVMARAAWGF